MNERQKAALQGKTLKTVCHLNLEDGGVLHQRCEELKLNKYVRTPKTKGRWGKGVVSWSVDGVDEEFGTLDEACVALEAEGLI